MNKKRFGISAVVVLSFLLICTAMAYSGVLDSFQGYDYTNVGQLAVDSFTLNDSNLITVIRIDDAQVWGQGGTAGMYVTACKKNFLGTYVAQQNLSFQKTANDTSYSELYFSGLSTGTYKMKFTSIYPDLVDFSGTVYDNY